MLHLEKKYFFLKEAILKSNLDKLVVYLFIVFLIEFVVATVVIILLTNGIRINRKCNIAKDGLELTQYEQVYHVFMNQEIFLQIKNKTEQMIGTLVVREKNSGITYTFHKLRPGKSTKLYFDLNTKFDDVEFEIVELKFVEMK